jgi:hypothetical protein
MIVRDSADIRLGKGKITLYHGSKSGINGNIRPVSRRFCDFGSGFYMGTEELQPLTLICNFPDAKLYTVEVDLTGLRVLELAIGIDWALLIAYHRGKLEEARGGELYRKYAAMLNNCDMVVAHIANDRMFVVLDRFFSGEITDKALVNCLSALKVGKQYVALTEEACKHIKVLEVKPIGDAERRSLRKKK